MLIIFIALISLLLQFFLPWWIIAPVAFGLAFWRAASGKHAFWSGFLALFLLWAVMALFKTIPNENLLANRVGQMFGFPDWAFNWIIMLLITALVGALVSGFSALAGFYCREAFLPEPQERKAV
ncbi:MAG: hypothetical protein K0S09_528 [Sphingobacteriaceae bacterium]|jgi:hypothetical protein|nr:hypothetical protein [Sphingobacteriaceae bacterium]